jgi:hypothetical protein
MITKTIESKKPIAHKKTIQAMKLFLLSLALLSAVVTSVEAADEPYWLHKEDRKCPYDNTRIFKYFGKDVEECYKECFDTPNCHHFSIGFHSGKINCMGCNGHESGVEIHNGFTTYAITEQEWQYTLVGRAKECLLLPTVLTRSRVYQEIPVGKAVRTQLDVVSLLSLILQSTSMVTEVASCVALAMV